MALCVLNSYANERIRPNTETPSTQEESFSSLSLAQQVRKLDTLDFEASKAIEKFESPKDRAANLFVKAPNIELDEEQQRYLRHYQELPTTLALEFVQVNMEVLKEDLLYIPIYNEVHVAEKRDGGVEHGGMKSWVGHITTVDYGRLNLAYSADMIVANIEFEDNTFAIHPLGKGVHVLLTVDQSAGENCSLKDGDDQPQLPDEPDVRKSFTDPDIVNNTSVGGDAKSTGECLIRVLVAYTPQARVSVANILLEIMNLVNLANTGYTNSGVNFQIELAHVYLTSYLEGSASMSTHLCRFASTLLTPPCGGYMNEVHSKRSLWKADQCVLIVSSGTGIAYTSLSYSSQFSVTGIGTFNNFTFHHELAHNAKCTHALNQSTQPGSIPYSGYGHPSGCFRTVMAYQDACGAGSCHRQNIFSADAIDWSCGDIVRSRGNQQSKNTERLNLSRNTIRGFEVVSSNALLTGAYTIANQEFISHVGSNQASYDGLLINQFIMQSGSQGHFRASQAVTIGPGFWAQSGATFDAYIESCAGIFPGFSKEASSQDENDNELMDEESAHKLGAGFNTNVFPNPFRTSATLILDVPYDSNVEVLLRDLTGRTVSIVHGSGSLVAGQYQMPVVSEALPSGLYLLEIRANDRIETLKVIKQN